MVTVAIGVPRITNNISYTVCQGREVSDMLSRATTLNLSHFISLQHQSQKILINWHYPLFQSMSITYYKYNYLLNFCPVMQIDSHSQSLDSENNLSSTATQRSNIVTQDT